MTTREKWFGGFVVLALIALYLWWNVNKGGIVAAGKVIYLSDNQRSIAALIRALTAGSTIPAEVYQGLALEESSLDPSKKSARSSYGLFEIYHAADFSWLRWAGYSDADLPKLYDATFNTMLAIRIVQYFTAKGFNFPSEADIYNVGESKWKSGIRNQSYRDNVIAYTDYFLSNPT